MTGHGQNTGALNMLHTINFRLWAPGVDATQMNFLFRLVSIPKIIHYVYTSRIQNVESKTLLVLNIVDKEYPVSIIKKEETRAGKRRRNE